MCVSSNKRGNEGYVCADVDRGVELLVIRRRYFKVLMTVFSTNNEAKSSTDNEHWGGCC